jgi:hypothetical protein
MNRQEAGELRRTCLAHQLSLIDDLIDSESPDAADLFRLRPQVVRLLAEAGPGAGSTSD